MGFFARAVITGFAFSLGTALFKQFQDKLGFDNEGKDKDSDKPESAPVPATSDDSGDSDPQA